MSFDIGDGARINIAIGERRLNGGGLLVRVGDCEAVADPRIADAGAHDHAEDRIVVAFGVLKSLEDENAKLKKLLAEAMLDMSLLKDVASKKW